LCALDEPEALRLHKLPSYDFVYVHAEEHEEMFPYTGSRWYAAEVEHMLEVEAVKPTHCQMGLRASRRLSGQQLAQHFEVIRECWKVAVENSFGDNDYARHIWKMHQKGAILALIGLWNHRAARLEVRDQQVPDGRRGVCHPQT
jgi:hypothetical protein